MTQLFASNNHRVTDVQQFRPLEKFRLQRRSLRNHFRVLDSTPCVATCEGGKTDPNFLTICTEEYTEGMRSARPGCFVEVF